MASAKTVGNEVSLSVICTAISSEEITGHDSRHGKIGAMNFPPMETDQIYGRLRRLVQALLEDDQYRVLN
jgi:hypothetical protein